MKADVAAARKKKREAAKADGLVCVLQRACLAAAAHLMTSSAPACKLPLLVAALACSGVLTPLSASAQTPVPQGPLAPDDLLNEMLKMSGYSLHPDSEYLVQRERTWGPGDDFEKAIEEVHLDYLRDRARAAIEEHSTVTPEDKHRRWSAWDSRMNPRLNLVCCAACGVKEPEAGLRTPGSNGVGDGRYRDWHVCDLPEYFKFNPDQARLEASLTEGIGLATRVVGDFSGVASQQRARDDARCSSQFPLSGSIAFLPASSCSVQP